MRIDPLLFRRILEDLEPITLGDPIQDFNVPGVDPVILGYHLLQLHAAGLLVGIDISGVGAPMYMPRDITPAGHSFLAMARDESSWGKVIGAAKGAGSQAVGAIYGALLASVLHRIGLGP